MVLFQVSHCSFPILIVLHFSPVTVAQETVLTTRRTQKAHVKRRIPMKGTSKTTKRSKRTDGLPKRRKRQKAVELYVAAAPAESGVGIAHPLVEKCVTEIIHAYVPVLAETLQNVDDITTAYLDAAQKFSENLGKVLELL